MKGSYCSLSLVDGRLEDEWGRRNRRRKLDSVIAGVGRRAPARFLDRENRALITCCWPKLRFCGAFNANKIANTRSIFDFSAENVKVADCLADRWGFEPPKPFRVLESAAAWSARLQFEQDKAVSGDRPGRPLPEWHAALIKLPLSNAESGAPRWFESSFNQA